MIPLVEGTSLTRMFSQKSFLRDKFNHIHKLEHICLLLQNKVSIMRSLQGTHNIFHVKKNPTSPFSLKEHPLMNKKHYWKLNLEALNNI